MSLNFNGVVFNWGASGAPLLDLKIHVGGQKVTWLGPATSASCLRPAWTSEATAETDRRPGHRARRQPAAGAAHGSTTPSIDVLICFDVLTHGSRMPVDNQVPVRPGPA